MDKVNLEVSWVGLWRIFFFILLVTLLFLGRQILLVLFLALVISSGLETIVDFLERRKLPRIVGVILVFLVLIAIVIDVLYTILPILVINLNNFLIEIGKSTNHIWGESINLPALVSIKSLNDLVNNLIVELFSGGISPLGFLSQIFGGLTLTVSVFIISFYLSLSRSGVENFILAILPEEYEEAAIRIYEKSRKKIGYWFQAQIILSLTMGFLVWLSLSILGVKYPVLLGVVAGIFELVPFVGPILAGALSVLIALGTSLPLAFYTLIVFLAIQQLESNVLVPLLTRRAVGLHPIIVIAALLMGIEIDGALGAIIAVPLAAVFQEIIDELAAKRKLRGA